MSKREDILNISETLFAVKGFNSVTTKRIAEESGCSELTIFRIFKTKEKLLEETIERIMGRMPAFFQQVDDSFSDDMEDSIRKVIALYLTMLFNNSTLFKIQLKLSEETGNNHFIITSRVYELLIRKFSVLFEKYKLEYPCEKFVNLLVTSVYGNYVFFTLDDVNAPKYRIDVLIDDISLLIISFFNNIK
ncbi:MAG: TetR/AcrR family transcriptional regulator [Sebaldella sp.]|nr:TetR/AcrR family transcriptional regulator [Sebaldella sp.]